MLPEILDLGNDITLISNTGVQFIDFGFSLERKEPEGLFSYLDNKEKIIPLAEDEQGQYFYMDDVDGKVSKKTVKKSDFEVILEDSLNTFDKCWMPIPVLRYSGTRFDKGPGNWARMRIVKLPEPDIEGNDYRITVAFDTNLMQFNERAVYLGPTEKDVAAPAVFKLAINYKETSWFFDQEWVAKWIEELYIEFKKKKNTDKDEIDEKIKEKKHFAHCLNLLKLMGHLSTEYNNTHKPKVILPSIKLVDLNNSIQKRYAVDLVIDLGNSRTCGILVEDHDKDNHGLLSNNYLLQLRDLTEPEKCYSDAFESRIEFNQVFLGKNDYSRKSGRRDAFLWPTFARVGAEANRLASYRVGSEGSTGSSSPKRYIWDEELYDSGWYLNNPFSNNVQDNKKAMVSPLSDYISELGESLLHPEDDEFSPPVLHPKYSRSSLMTFMLAEILSHALMQINSVAQRIRSGHADAPRYLKNIILTVPPGMPLAERSILYRRLTDAIELVWLCLGWSEENEDDSSEDDINYIVKAPEINLQWDEATAGQLVYLYNEITENFSRRSEEFFASLKKPDADPATATDKNSVTVATIDIGGGTTDLVINEYKLEEGTLGSNTNIIPKQLFRESVKVAGDDILLDVIQKFIIPAFGKALQETGVSEIDTLLSKICGSESSSKSEEILRQQLNLQFFTPLGLAVLGEYEEYDFLKQGSKITTYSFSDLLPDKDISEPVQNYVNSKIRLANIQQELNLKEIEITIDFAYLHSKFLNQNGFNIVRSLILLSEVIACYDCDVLLLTGRPSKLPGIKHLVTTLTPVIPSRIVVMHNYYTRGWYPFNVNGRITDPKTTASVGALLCMLSYNNKLQNFYFRSDLLRPYSTIRYIGVLDDSGSITENNIIFKDITTENEKNLESGLTEIDYTSDKITLPTGADDTPITFDMKGKLVLGFKQLPVDRWPASPLYLLSFTEEGNERYKEAKLKSESRGIPVEIKIELKVSDSKKDGKSGSFVLSDKLEVASITSNCTPSFTKKSYVKLELNTMQGLNNRRYWLDSGSVK